MIQQFPPEVMSVFMSELIEQPKVYAVTDWCIWDRGETKPEAQLAQELGISVDEIQPLFQRGIEIVSARVERYLRDEGHL